MLFQTDDATILIPTDRPNGDRLVASGDSASGFNYAANGSSLLFNRTTADDQVEIVLLDTEKLTERQLAVGDDLVSATPLPNGTAAILVSSKGLSVIDFEYRAQAQIGELDGDVLSMLIGPNSGTIAYMVAKNDQAAWYWANLHSGEIDELTDVAGSPRSRRPPSALGSLYAAWCDLQLRSWWPGLFIARSFDREDESAFHHHRGHELPAAGRLTRGRALRLAALDHGRRAEHFSLDNRTGVAQPVFESRAVSGVLSPDGCWAAVTRQIGARTANQLQIVLIPLDGSAEVMKSAAVSRRSGSLARE